jgi:hypothetical protein
VVEVDGEDGLREDLLGGADDGLEHALVGVVPGALEIWMMNGALESMQPLKRPMHCSALLMLYAPMANLP